MLSLLTCYSLSSTCSTHDIFLTFWFPRLTPSFLYLSGVRVPQAHCPQLTAKQPAAATSNVQCQGIHHHSSLFNTRYDQLLFLHAWISRSHEGGHITGTLVRIFSEREREKFHGCPYWLKRTSKIQDEHQQLLSHQFWRAHCWTLVFTKITFSPFGNNWRIFPLSSSSSMMENSCPSRTTWLILFGIDTPSIAAEQFGQAWDTKRQQQWCL